MTDRRRRPVHAPSFHTQRLNHFCRRTDLLDGELAVHARAVIMRRSAARRCHSRTALCDLADIRASVIRLIGPDLAKRKGGVGEGLPSRPCPSVRTLRQ